MQQTRSGFSLQERDRRWARVRQLMAQQAVDLKRAPYDGRWR